MTQGTNLDAPWYCIGNRVYSNSGIELATINTDSLSLEDGACIIALIASAPDMLHNIALAQTHLECAKNSHYWQRHNAK